MSSSGSEKALIGQLPDTPAGRRLAWWLGMIADEGVRASPADRDRFAPSLHAPLEARFDAERMHDAWRRDAGRLGAPTKISLEKSGEHEIVAAVATANDRKWTLSVTVEPEPPHRMLTFRIDRQHDFKLDVREATAADALIVADIERRCPIVMGDTSTWFDRGASYFDFARLMEDCTVGLASVDGVPAAVSCGAVHQIRVGGALKTTVTYSHLRVLPEHQRKGLWGAANRALDKYRSRADGTSAYISVDNLAMQHGFAGTPDKWPQTVQRVELDCAALAGPPVGRAASPADASEIVRRLNAFHDAEELFVPYTEASFAARVERAPDLYGWDRLWMTDGAVVGVWPAGTGLKTISETNGARTVTVPAVALDYAFAPGAEAELEALLRAWCAWLAPRGIDTLVIYTSPASVGTARLCGLARSVGAFFTWTPGIRVPPGAEARGLYVDAVYF
jgi:hypothetical protein